MAKGENFITKMLDDVPTESYGLRSFLKQRKNQVDRHTESLSDAALAIPEHRMTVLHSIYVAAVDGESAAVVVVPDAVEAMFIANWMHIIYALTFGGVTYDVTYNTLAQEVRDNSRNIPMYQKNPFLIILFPELVSNAGWLQATLLDLIQTKRHVLILTADPDKMKNAFGELIIKTLNKMGATSIVMD